MGKPSIFSREYNRKMKRRKRLKTVTLMIIAVISVLLILLVLKGPSFARWVNSKINSSNSPVNPKDKDKTEETKPDKQEAAVIEKSIKVTLSDNSEIGLVYEEKDGIKKFKYVTPSEKNTEYTISPSEKSIVVRDSNTQELLYYDVEGVKKNLTLESYYAGTLNKDFPKDDILKETPDYLWHGTPVFIDDNTLAYTSQLPWFTRKKILYVWLIDISTGKHRAVDRLNGEILKFDRVEDKGLKVVIDNDKIYYLSADGTISQ